MCRLMNSFGNPCKPLLVPIQIAVIRMEPGPGQVHGIKGHVTLDLL